VFAPGTLKNGPNNPGNYNYWIGGIWDTTLVPDGAYRLAVTAADIDGNKATKTVGFLVANHPATGNTTSP